MNSTILKITLVLLLAACSHLTYAQCDKTVVFKSSKTNYLDGEGNVARTKEEATTITISKTTVIIIPGDDDHKMTGSITANTCDWKTPFKDGKMVIKASVENPDGIKQHSTLTVIGIAGKISITYEAEERPGVKIQVVADTFEEKES